jgi:hypothetical protein
VYPDPTPGDEFFEFAAEQQVRRAAGALEQHRVAGVVGEFAEKRA